MALVPPQAAVVLTRASTDSAGPPVARDPIAPPPVEYVRARSDASVLMQRRNLESGRHRFTDRLLERLTSADRGLQANSPLIRAETTSTRASPVASDTSGFGLFEAELRPLLEEEAQAIAGSSAVASTSAEPAVAEGSQGAPPVSVPAEQPTETASGEVAATAPQPPEGEGEPSPEALAAKAAAWRCNVCLESNCETHEEFVCPRKECKGLTCKGCLREHFQREAAKCRYTLFPIRCPTCRQRIPCKMWQTLVSQGTVEEYEKGAVDLLSIRCPSCDDTGSMYQEGIEDGQARDDAMKAFLDKVRIKEGGGEGGNRAGPKEQELRRAWSGFQTEAVSVEEVVASILAAVDEDISQFVSEDRGGSLPQVLRLITDLERRTVLHLCALRKHPFIYTQCCSEPVCFKCKISGHHTGKDCAEVQREALEVECQFCPDCGVATQKTEGCDSIVCLCGATWTWEGEDLGMLHDDMNGDEDSD